MAPDVNLQRSLDPLPASPSSKFFNFLGLAGLVAVLVSLVRWASRPLSDPDTWWHLRVGDEFWNGWSLRSPGTLSPLAENDWVARDWLPQMVASKFAECFGLPGVAWLAGAIMLSYAVASWFASRGFADPIPTAIAVAVAVFGASPSLSARPQLVSFILLAVFVAAWMRTGVDHKPRWWLIPLTMLWACSHGMWVIGVLVGALVTLGMGLDRVVDRRTFCLLGAVPVFGVALAILTPAGPAVVVAAIQANPARDYITEWQPVDILSSPPAMMTALAIAIVAVHFMRVGRVPWSRALLLFSAALWTVLSGRTVALGAATVAPLLAEVMQHWLRSRSIPVHAKERVSIAILFGCALVGLAALVPATANEPDGYPTSMNARLSSWPKGTVVLNAHELGGWLEWEHRQLTVVVDGNMPAYGPEYQEAYIFATHLRPGWRAFVTDSGAEYALLENSVPLRSGLQLLGWQQLAREGAYVLMAPPSVDRQ